MTLFNKWVEKQRAKDRCGFYPAQLPKSFYFTTGCALHDLAYVDLRIEFVYSCLMAGVSYEQAVKRIDSYKPAIMVIDWEFSKYMEHEAILAPYGLKWLYKATANLFTRIVKKSGWDTWKQVTFEQLQKVYQSDMANLSKMLYSQEIQTAKN